MLVLSRKVGQRIVLPGSGVTVTVLSQRGQTIRLGFDAPPDVLVCREEIFHRLDAAADRPSVAGAPTVR